MFESIINAIGIRWNAFFFSFNGWMFTDSRNGKYSEIENVSINVCHKPKFIKETKNVESIIQWFQSMLFCLMLFWHLRQFIFPRRSNEKWIQNNSETLLLRRMHAMLWHLYNGSECKFCMNTMNVLIVFAALVNERNLNRKNAFFFFFFRSFYLCKKETCLSKRWYSLYSVVFGTDCNH